MSKVWVVGKYKSGEFPNVVWDIQGVFDDFAVAIEACRSQDHFVAPLEMNQLLPNETKEWPELVYPLAPFSII